MPVASPPKKRGPKKRFTPDEQGRKQRDYARNVNAQNSFATRDIEEGWNPKAINWKRRLACKRDLKLTCETYFNPIFYLGWSDDQLRCIRKVEQVFLDGGTFALAMPRGGGKTAICRSAVIWGTAYSHRRFPYLVGSTEANSNQSLDALKMQWYRNKALREDFPEIGYPIFRLENRFHLARGQLFRGQPTLIEWSTGHVRYPSLLLSREDAETYLKHDPDSVWYSKEHDAYIPKSAGIMVATAGIDGSIRGEAEIHPITLEQPRPDVVLLDDVQKDQKAESPASCAKVIRLIDGAIQNLSGPDHTLAAIMPCTVIREGDVSDTFLDPLQRPEWQGERCKMVLSWPPGITDFEITNETTESKHWLEYAELRKRSFRVHGDSRLATAYYKKNRKAMDRRFVVSWKDRFDKKGRNAEISAQQHAMNLRLRSPESFLPEFQNQGRRLYEEGEVLITASQVAEKTTKIREFEIPTDCTNLVAFIDVQNEILFYCTFAFNSEFSGIIPHYGTWPPTHPGRFFTKNQTAGWSLLTHGFFKQYPEHKAKAITSGKGRLRAPLEPKLYWALTECLAHLDGLQFIRQDEHRTQMRIDKIGVDARWGQAADVIKKFIHDQRRPHLIVYNGQSMPPTHLQFEQFQRTRGWLFEDQRNPTVKEVKWVYKPGKDGHFHLLADVDRLKDFLYARLASPLGSRGSICLYDAPPERHEMFANHICAEYPEPLTARGITKNVWQVRENKPDNDWLDCAVGCMALASTMGAALLPNPGQTVQRSANVGRRVTDRWKRK